MAGALAVSLVAVLVVAARSLVGADWGEPLSIWLPMGAVSAMVAGWAITARLRHQHGGAVTMPPARQGTEARGVRRHRRYVPANTATTLYTQDGRHIAARIANVSVAAVAIDAKLSDLDYRTVLRVGSREVGPIRRTPTGAVFGFATILDPQPFDESFVL